MTGTFVRRLVLSLAALPLLAAVDAAAQDDHLKCFEVKDLVTRNERVTADLAPTQNPPFEAQNCKVRLRAGHYCVAASKDNVLGPDGNPYETGSIDAGAAGDYFCYLVRCKREAGVPPKGRELRVRDQFGERNIFVKTADFLCAPVETDPVPTPTPTFTPDATETPTPSTTPTATATETETATPTETATAVESATPTASPTPQPCADTGGGQCGGTCPDTQVCVSIPTKGDPQCICQPAEVACSDLDIGTGAPPVCGGLCPNAGDTCQTAGFNGDSTCACFPPPPCGDLGGGVCGGACADAELCLFDPQAGTCGCESVESACRRVDIGTGGASECVGFCGLQSGTCVDDNGLCICQIQ
jgi:hypothetical protein